MLDKIEQWTEDFEQSPIFWLRGLAGSGKSTIAQTIAERLFADGRLGASFFCSSGSDDRSNLRLIFPTLAFQLSLLYPKFRSSFIRLLQSNPDIVYQSIQDQAEQFLVEPLRSAGVSTVIVIDALDECRDEDPQSAILPVLGKAIQNIRGVKLFITSRPETHLMAGFHGPLQGSMDFLILHEVEPLTIDQDIRLFFEHELSKLARHRGGKEGWPTDEQLCWLCRRASGFFVFAVATVNLLNHHLEDPWDQLDTLIQSSESTAPEGEVRLKVYKTLDSLYLSILRTSFRENRATDDVFVRSVLSWVVLAKEPLTPCAIATLIGLSCHKVQRVLELTQSLLVMSSDPNKPVRPFHKSFPDFITDQTRCIDPRFYISSDSHTESFMCCHKLMGKPLPNMPSLPDYDKIDQPEDLPKTERSNICSALQYASRSWRHHLVATENATPDVLLALLDILEGKFVLWLVVLGALGSLEGSSYSMDSTIHWLEKVGPDQ